MTRWFFGAGLLVAAAAWPAAAQPPGLTSPGAPLVAPGVIPPPPVWRNVGAIDPDVIHPRVPSIHYPGGATYFVGPPGDKWPVIVYGDSDDSLFSFPERMPLLPGVWGGMHVSGGLFYSKPPG